MEKSSPLVIVPYGSLETALNHFHESGGAPSELHGSVFPKEKFSGTTIALLVKALKQFGLENADGATLHDRIDPLIDPATRKVAFQTLLQQHYGSLISLPLTNASPNQFNKWFDDFHMNADDTRKAKTFFLHAAKANDIPVSPFILKRFKVRSRGAAGTMKVARPAPARGSSTSKAAAAAKLAKAKREQANQEQSEPNGQSKIVALRSGIGSVTVSASISWTELEGSERDLVFGLLDLLKKYERAQADT